MMIRILVFAPYLFSISDVWLRYSSSPKKYFPIFILINNSCFEFVPNGLETTFEVINGCMKFTRNSFLQDLVFQMPIVRR